MKNKRWIICYDYETDGPNPEECNPVELAAIPIDPDTLEIRSDKAFTATIKPPGIDKDDYFTKGRLDTIAWHAKTRGTTDEEIVKEWRAGTSEKIVWKNFTQYCKKLEVEKTPGNWFTEPVAAGYNIIGFDNIIMKRLSERYKTKYPFSKINKLDLMDQMFFWFESLEQPKNQKLDTYREFFGLKPEQAHEAFSDTLDTAKLLVQFMKFTRLQSSVGKFRGAMAGR